MFDEVMEASDLLCQHDVNPSIYTFPTVKPIDRDTIAKCANEYDLIITVEEHNIIGGFGSAVSEVLAELSGVNARVSRVGLEDKYSSIVGSQKYLRDQYGISAEKIAAKVKDALNE